MLEREDCCAVARAPLFGCPPTRTLVRTWYLLFCTLVCRAGAGHGAGLRVRCLYGTDAHLSVQVCGRTRALQHPYHLHSIRALNKTGFLVTNGKLPIDNAIELY